MTDNGYTTASRNPQRTNDNLGKHAGMILSCAWISNEAEIKTFSKSLKENIQILLSFLPFLWPKIPSCLFLIHIWNRILLPMTLCKNVKLYLFSFYSLPPFFSSSFTFTLTSLRSLWMMQQNRGESRWNVLKCKLVARVWHKI